LLTFVAADAGRARLLPSPTTVQKDDISREALKELLFDEIMSFKSID
jgi:hypothetical protein